MAKSATMEVADYIRPIAKAIDVLGGYEYSIGDVLDDFVNYAFSKNFIIPNDTKEKYRTSKISTVRLPNTKIKIEKYIPAYSKMYDLLVAMYNSMVYLTPTLSILEQQLLCSYPKENVDSYLSEIRSMSLDKAEKIVYKKDVLLKDKLDYKESLALLRMSDFWHTRGAMETRFGGLGWIDPFGDLFMAYLSSSHKGQFFTPEHLCDLNSKMLAPSGNVSDPTSGSGRMILSAHANFRHRDVSRIPNKNGLAACDDDKFLHDYYYGFCNDIDSRCSKMSAINMSLHKVPGQVTCGNGLWFSEQAYWAVEMKYFQGSKGAIEYHNLAGNDIVGMYIDDAEKEMGIVRNGDYTNKPMIDCFKAAQLGYKRFHQAAQTFVKQMIVLIPVENSMEYICDKNTVDKAIQRKKEATEKAEKRKKELVLAAQSKLTSTLSNDEKELLKEAKRKRELKKKEDLEKLKSKAKPKKSISKPANNNQISLF